MSDSDSNRKREIVVRRTLQSTLIAIGITQLAVTAIVNLALILLGLISLVLIGLGLYIRSTPTVAIGTILNLVLVFVFRWHSRRALNLVVFALSLTVDVAIQLLILAYVISAVACVAGGVWISRFSLTAFGLALSAPVMYCLYTESRPYTPRGWTVPPKEHLLTNRLRPQEEAQEDAKRLWPKP